MKQLTPPCRLQPDRPVTLLGHCSEKTNAPGSQEQWQDLFAALGLELRIENTGCCGMAGTFGHETRNLETSRHIYDLSWGAKVAQLGKDHVLLATGYSCRSQVSRFDGIRLRHPLEYLRDRFRDDQ